MRPTVYTNGTGSLAGTFRPQLTSLVDVMTILLVFLIKSFSVEGNLVTPSENLQLPLSTSRLAPRPVPTIEITREAVMSQGSMIAPLAGFDRTDTLTIPQLYDWMTVERAKAGAYSGREVMIQSDRDIEFNVVKRVMYTCSKAGYDDFTVLVLQES